MAYPDTKETFRRVENQDLPDVDGDIVDEDDHNLPVDFLERLQDVLGLDILGGFGSVKLRLDDLTTKTGNILSITPTINCLGSTTIIYEGNNNTWGIDVTVEAANEIVLFYFNTQLDNSGTSPAVLTEDFRINGVAQPGDGRCKRPTNNERDSYTFLWIDNNPTVETRQYRLKFTASAGDWGFHKTVCFALRIHK